MLQCLVQLEYIPIILNRKQQVWLIKAYKVKVLLRYAVHQAKYANKINLLLKISHRILNTLNKCCWRHARENSVVV